MSPQVLTKEIHRGRFQAYILQVLCRNVIADIQRVQTQIISVIKVTRRCLVGVFISTKNRLWIFCVLIIWGPEIRLTSILTKGMGISAVGPHVVSPAVINLMTKGIIHIGTQIKAIHIKTSIQAPKFGRRCITSLVVTISFVIVISRGSPPISIVHIPERVTVFWIYSSPFTHIPGIHLVSFNSTVTGTGFNINGVAIGISRQVGNLILYSGKITSKVPAKVLQMFDINAQLHLQHLIL